VGFPGPGQPMGHRDFDRPPVAGAATASLGDVPSLPAGDGRETVITRCAQCHDVQTVTAKRRSAEEWRAQIDRMRQQYHVTLEPTAIDRIVTYLSQHFGK
jgi:hypothetical protein